MATLPSPINAPSMSVAQNLVSVELQRNSVVKRRSDVLLVRKMALSTALLGTTKDGAIIVPAIPSFLSRYQR